MPIDAINGLNNAFYHPILTAKNVNADIKEGDKIVTSNISTKFLPGILIGYATEISTDDSRLTKSGYLIPIASFDTLQEVLVITNKKTGGQ